MSLVNLEGTSIFGAGSEWFWAMAQFVLVAASILGIYVQLRAQRASTLFDQSAAWSREWLDEAFLVHRLAALVELEGRPIEAGLPGAAKNVGDFFSRIGYLVAMKHLRASDVREELGFPIRFWWRLMAPYIRRSRELEAQPGLYASFETLELEMRTMGQETDEEDAPAGVSAAGIRTAIDELTQELRRLADARNGIYPTRRTAEGEPAESPQPATPA